jgi:shikimate dehydrogenase
VSTISAPLKVAGVIGWPVSHSLSPKLHAHWLGEYAVGGLYVPVAVRKEDFSPVVRTLWQAGFVGVNVTLPHKQAAFAVAHDHDDAALASRSANLLIFGDAGRIAARNTDTSGFQASVIDAVGPEAFKGTAAVVLGAGGAARSVVLALDRLGTGLIGILNRSRPRAESLISELAPRTKARLELVQESDWSNVASAAALLVNATSAGLNGEMPIALPLGPLPPACVVCDLVYNPFETEFLKEARRRGLRTIDGLGMLMHQAVPSFAAFYGITPQVTPALRRELERALQR